MSWVEGLVEHKRIKAKFLTTLRSCHLGFEFHELIQQWMILSRPRIDDYGSHKLSVENCSWSCLIYHVFSQFLLYLSCSPLMHALQSITIHATPHACYDIDMYTDNGIVNMTSSSFIKQCNNPNKRWIYDKFIIIFLNGERWKHICANTVACNGGLLAKIKWRHVGQNGVWMGWDINLYVRMHGVTVGRCGPK